MGRGVQVAERAVQDCYWAEKLWITYMYDTHYTAHTLQHTQALEQRVPLPPSLTSSLCVGLCVGSDVLTKQLKNIKAATQVPTTPSLPPIHCLLFSTDHIHSSPSVASLVSHLCFVCVGV